MVRFKVAVQFCSSEWKGKRNRKEKGKKKIIEEEGTQLLTIVTWIREQSTSNSGTARWLFSLLAQRLHTGQGTVSSHFPTKQLTPQGGSRCEKQQRRPALIAHARAPQRPSTLRDRALKNSEARKDGAHPRALLPRDLCEYGTLSADFCASSHKDLMIVTGRLLC